jgi:hypothetical protein
MQITNFKSQIPNKFQIKAPIPNVWNLRVDARNLFVIWRLLFAACFSLGAY